MYGVDSIYKGRTKDKEEAVVFLKDHTKDGFSVIEITDNKLEVHKSIFSMKKFEKHLHISFTKKEVYTCPSCQTENIVASNAYFVLGDKVQCGRCRGAFTLTAYKNNSDICRSFKVVADK